MTLHRPGIWKTPAPFLPMALPISAARASKTAPTSFLETPVASEMLAYTSDLLGAFALAFFAMVATLLVRFLGETETGKYVFSAPADGRRLLTVRPKMQAAQGPKSRENRGIWQD